MVSPDGKQKLTDYIEIQGRYVLSLTAHEGFVKSGSIRDIVIGFEAGGQQYEIRFMTPIAGAGKAWNLYVLDDRTYQSRLSNGISVGVDRLENLLPGH